MLSTVKVGGQFNRKVDRYVPRWTHDPVFPPPSGEGTHCVDGKSTATCTCGLFSTLPPRKVATSSVARLGTIFAVNLTNLWSSNSISCGSCGTGGKISLSLSCSWALLCEKGAVVVVTVMM